MSALNVPETVTLPIDEVKPYWRNPRRIPPEAVTAVRESIERYGYQQPIVVDSSHVIVVGHTRLAALKEMGATEVEVYVTDLPEDKVREYRLVDNRTSELSQWDHSALVMELREWETGLLEQFFPDVDLEISVVDDAPVTETAIDEAVADVLRVKEAPVIRTTEVVCPACFHTFEVRTDSLPGLSRDDMEASADGASL
jgi:hypothetical protein